ncbi:hypothetical protein [Aeromicrobium sp. HA]|uniref:hypothetical protein n=1 Tax=Aeromicrobium sp. HA TaxID=3009077 RepID=UPI0022AF37B5|nr:hypothetical protein [Aeromicrobium sp. HA]
MSNHQSDARKRAAEKAQEFITSAAQAYDVAADQPPTLPDTSTWVRRAPGDVIEAGTPYIYRSDVDGALTHYPSGRGSRYSIDADMPGSYWTPPPAPSEPWSSISTDRDKPTLARVTWDDGSSFTGNLHVDGKIIRDDLTQSMGLASEIESVDLLHTHNPETHVPVERALIERVLNGGDTAQRLRADGLFGIASAVAALASLASDESSASDGGRS